MPDGIIVTWTTSAIHMPEKDGGGRMAHETYPARLASVPGLQHSIFGHTCSSTALCTCTVVVPKAIHEIAPFGPEVGSAPYAIMVLFHYMFGV